LLEGNVWLLYLGSCGWYEVKQCCAQLPLELLQSELGSVVARQTFGDTFPLQHAGLADLPPQTLIPGVCLRVSDFPVACLRSATLVSSFLHALSLCSRPRR
jgi:hypothetical protein